MKIKTMFFCLLAVILLISSVAVDAANVPESRPLGNEPWSKEFVDSYPNAKVGTHVSIAHHPLNGKAYISYYDAVNGDLWLAYQVSPGTGNCHGNNDWKCVLVDSEGDVGQFSSIDVTYVTQFQLSITIIGIAYHDATNRALKFADYRENRMPPWRISTLDAPLTSTGSRGTYASMKFDNNNVPVIGYHTQDTYGIVGAVKIASRVGADGTGCNGGSPDWSCEIIDSAQGNIDFGTHVSIDINWLNNANVAFFNSVDNSLDFARPVASGTGSCSNNYWNCITVDQGPGRGKYISIYAKKSLQDRTRFAYYDQSEGKIRYAYSVSGTGNCTNSGFNCYWVDEVGTFNGHFGLSMAVDDQGLPIIAYMEGLGEEAPIRLRIARPRSAYGENYGNCGEEQDMFLIWTCKTLDSYGDTDMAEYVGVSLNPAGLATVAYSVDFHLDDQTFLRVAEQHFKIYLPLINK